jgi:hypothetical protein
MSNQILDSLERRLGRLHVRQRIGIEDDIEARVFDQGLNYFHPEMTPTALSAIVKDSRSRQASNEGLHLRLADGKFHELIRHSFGGGARSRSALG